MLTQEDLAGSGCATPGCTCQSGPLILHSACHPDAPTWVEYHREGFLQVTCAECERTIAQIKVGRRATLSFSPN